MKQALPPFSVYDASAGAGKTFALVREYLRICLQAENPQAFKNVLAITFTNKAAREMKVRILKQLEALSRGAPDAMAQQLMTELQLSTEEIQDRSEKLLHQVLHYYSAFAVSTIDKFTNRIIRSFSRELQLSYTYEVEINSHKMVREAVEMLLDALRPKSPEAVVLTQFLRSQLDEEKSPRLETDITNLVSQILWQEAAWPYLQQLLLWSTADYLPVHQKLKAEQNELKVAVSTKAGEFLQFMSDQGVDQSHFSKAGNLYLEVQRLQQGGMGSLARTNTLQKMLAGEKSFSTKKQLKAHSALLIPLAEDLRQRTLALEEYVQPRIARYRLLAVILKPYFSMAVMGAVNACLEEIKTRDNRLPIGEFNRLISRQIAGQPAPFLYEKLGERYRHFFIDEFQDTSELQWHNLVPLINNALAGKGASAMLVGDAKQAIYRFRGGVARQFIDLANDRDTTNRVRVNDKEQILYTRGKVKLECNYRSRKEIVHFNNALFTGLAPDLPPWLSPLYAEATQRPRGAEGGRVEVKLYPKNDCTKEELLEDVWTRIQHCLQRGYAPGDICLLFRQKTEAALCGHFLQERQMPFVGSDTLRLNHSTAVEVLISGIRLLQYPDDEQGRLPILEYVWEHHRPPDTDPYLYFQQWGKAPVANFWQEVWRSAEEPAPLERLRRSNAYEALILLLGQLHPAWVGDPYVQVLLDESHHLLTRGEGSFLDLLQWWEDGGQDQKVPLPEQQGAILVDTIHQVKGLEFPVVMVPFTDWQLFSSRHTQAWLDLREEDCHGLPAAFVKLKAEVEEPVVPAFRELTEQEVAESTGDAVNLLYVALTRPVDELYLFGRLNKTNNDNSVVQFLERFTATQGDTGEGVWGEYVYPTAPPRAEAKVQLQYQAPGAAAAAFTRPMAPGDWQVAGPRERGRLWHFLLSELPLNGDWADILKRQLESGSLPPEEEVAYRKVLLDIVRHPQLRLFFAGRGELLCERELLWPGRSSLRPDRVVPSKGAAHILDYKTGAPHPTHRGQVEEYAAAFRQMGYTAGKQALVYLGATPQVEIW